MVSTRLLGAWPATLICLAGATPTIADDGKTTASSATIRAKPAVLVLRAWEPLGRKGVPRIAVLDPPGLRWPLFQPDRPPPQVRSDTGAPQLGEEFKLVRTWAPDPQQPELHYYIYHVDLNNPAVARNWRALRRAQFDERRRQQAVRQSERHWAGRKQRLLDANRQAVHDGVALLRAGAYRPAVITLTRAAELNHGDALSRLHLAQARMALGHDVEAAKALRRALELRPKLVPAQLELGQYYSSEVEFRAQVDALGDRLANKKNATAEEYFLLGFMEFQRNRWDAAHVAFRAAARDLSEDERVQTYLSLTKPAEP